MGKRVKSQIHFNLTCALGVCTINNLLDLWSIRTQRDKEKRKGIIQNKKKRNHIL